MSEMIAAGSCSRSPSRHSGTEPIERVVAIGALHHRVAVAAQRCGQQRAQRVVVLDEQDLSGAHAQDQALNLRERARRRVV